MTDKELHVNLSRDFKGIWIPREIWLHPTLSIQAKTLWAEIDSLNDEEKGGCYASDDYLIRFLGVKASRLHEVMKELKDEGLLEKVSFNGRNRIMKAIHPKEVIKKKVTGKQGSGKPESCPPENRNPEFQETGTLPYNRDTSLVPSIESPPIPPQKEAAIAVAAEAAEVENLDSPKEKPKRTRTPSEFSPSVKQLSEQLINTIVRHEPDYVPPKNLAPFMTEIDFMLRLDKREPNKIVDVLSWALSDSFWRDKMFKPNPAKYLREKFLQLKNKMEAIPTAAPRKFAPSSNDARALETMEEMRKRAL